MAAASLASAGRTALMNLASRAGDALAARTGDAIEAAAVIGSRVRWVFQGVRWVRAPQGWVRHLGIDAEHGPSRGTVVLVPGLGMPRYTVPLSRSSACVAGTS